ncbi:MAG: hypothetical protein K2W95_14820 [Candidatus Obscuribacterales bacterium]|nr:hypothetical protein [Candidatus Obscuribacterales bacterium]
MFDRKNIRLIAAAMSWPIILFTAWLGGYLFGGAGMIVGTFLGLGIYFWGIFRSLPKD